ncbi:cupin domain-containing protein [Chloroflexota bacterium]
MSRESVRVDRWPEDRAPAESTIRHLMAGEGLQPYRWSNSPGDSYSAHIHAYHKVLYVVEGSITLGLPDEEKRVTLQPGDRLDLPAHTLHDAAVGPGGVVCLEAQRGDV